MTTPEEKIISAKAYIAAVINWHSSDPYTYNDDYEEKRADAHLAMITTYDCNPVNTVSVTNNLDIWIGLELDRGINPKLNDIKINLYALKLHNILESKDFRDGGYSYVCDETKRLRAEWYDK